MPPNALRNTVKGSAWRFVAEGVALPTGLLTVAFLTRSLGPENYGLYSLAAAIVIFVETAIANMLNGAAIRIVGRADDWRPVGATILRAYTVVSAGAALAVVLATPTIARALGEPDVASHLALFALYLPAAGFANGHVAIAIGLGDHRASALARATRWTGRALLIVLLVWFGQSITGAILGAILATLVELLVIRRYVRPPLLQRPYLSPRALFDYGAPLFISGLALLVYARLDLFGLTMLQGTARDAGYYAAAQNLAWLPGLLAMAFAPVLLANLNRVLHAGNEPAGRELARHALRLAIGLLPFAAAAAGAAHEVVRFVYGDAFAPAAPALALLIVAGVTMIPAHVVNCILVAIGRPYWCLLVSVPLVPLALAGHVVLIPALGIPGAAFVTAATALVAALAAFLMVYRLWRLPPPVATIVRSVIVAGIAYAMAALWPAAGALLPFKLAVVSVVIVATFALLGEFNRRERAAAAGFVLAALSRRSEARH